MLQNTNHDDDDDASVDTEMMMLVLVPKQLPNVDMVLENLITNAADKNFRFCGIPH